MEVSCWVLGQAEMKQQQVSIQYPTGEHLQHGDGNGNGNGDGGEMWDPASIFSQSSSGSHIQLFPLGAILF